MSLIEKYLLPNYSIFKFGCEAIVGCGFCSRCSLDIISQLLLASVS